MKIVIKVLTIGLLFFIISITGKAQDQIITNDGRTFSCDITQITAEKISFITVVNNKKNNTYVLVNEIKSYSLAQVEALKKDFDASAYFTLMLEDGSSLIGKIVSFVDPNIIFHDNSLGKITIKGETIKSYSKEDITAFYNIILNDGNKLYGQILKREKKELVFQTENLGKINIPVQNIKKIQKVEKTNLVAGEYWFPNPNNTRYLFSPTAIPLKKGEGYYQNADIIVNSANYGVSNNFTIGGGIVLPAVAFLTPKVGFKLAEKLYIGAGAIVGVITGPSLVGIVYGITTYGSGEHNITLGSGYGFAEDESLDGPIITLSGMTRVARRVSLVTENWAIPIPASDYVNGQYVEKTEYMVFLSYGMRFMPNEKYSFDFAFINSRDIIEFIPIGIPFIDFVIKF
jgi:hypothetical protein